MENETIEYNNEEFNWIKYLDILVLVRKNDKYINVSTTFKDESKKLNKFLLSKRWKKILYYWMEINTQPSTENINTVIDEKMLILPYNESIQTISPYYIITNYYITSYSFNFLCGTYVHPSLFYFILNHLRIDFMFETSNIINSISKYTNKFNASLSSFNETILNPLINNKIEQQIFTEKIRNKDISFIQSYLRQFFDDDILILNQKNISILIPNLKFQIEFHDELNTDTLNKFELNINTHKPRLGVFVSINDISKNMLKLDPVRLYISILSFDEKLISFIKSSQYYTTDEYANKLLTNIILNSSKIHPSFNNNNSVIKPQLNKSKFEIDKEQIREFIADNKEKFESIKPNSHMMTNYIEWCKRKQYVPINGPKNYLTKLLREFCVGCMKNVNSSRCGYVINDSPIVKEYIADLEKFMKDTHETFGTLYNNQVKSYEAYLSYITKNNLKLMTRDSFFKYISDMI